MRTGAASFMSADIPSGIVRSRTSHKVEATRYNVARSEGVADFRCSKNNRRLKPGAATREASSDVTNSISSCVEGL